MYEGKKDDGEKPFTSLTLKGVAMQSEMSWLAQKLWSELQPLLLPTTKTEAAQRMVDMFEEAGCRDLHECVQLTDTARESILDGDTPGLRFYDELADFDGFEILEDVEDSQ